MFILNRVLSKSVPKTPFKLFKGWKHRLNHFCVWGCSAEIRIYDLMASKLSPKTTRYYFIGYPINSKGYGFYCPTCGTRIVEAITAKFLENDLSNLDVSIHEGSSSGCQHVMVPIPIVQERVVHQLVERIP